MSSFKFVLLTVSLLPSLWFTSTADSGPPVSQIEKRFSINMMDPFTRRSALDKNFVRFGRSGSSSGAGRESRGRPDSFVRFGRSEKAREEEERGEEDDSILRDARGRTDFIRFGRGRQDNFIRFGRGGDKNSGFIRFGRARPDNFIRFGRGRPDNFIRFGKSLVPEDDDEEPGIENPDDSGNEVEEFDRISRGGNMLNKNFVRFGKRDPENNEEIVNAYKNGMNIESQALKENLARFSRLPPRNNFKSDSFIRFGRASFDDDTARKEWVRRFSNFLKENTNLVGNSQAKPSSLFRENAVEDEVGANSNTENDNIDGDLSKAPSTPANGDSSDIYLPYAAASGSAHELIRKKRSHSSRSDEVAASSSKTEDSTITDRSNLSSSFYSPLAAGLPGFIIGPELSVLPVHQPTQKCGKSDDVNFIRLG